MKISDLKKGDKVRLGKGIYRVTAVGKEMVQLNKFCWFYPTSMKKIKEK